MMVANAITQGWSLSSTGSTHQAVHPIRVQKAMQTCKVGKFDNFVANQEIESFVSFPLTRSNVNNYDTETSIANTSIGLGARGN